MGRHITLKTRLIAMALMAAIIISTTIIKNDTLMILLLSGFVCIGLWIAVWKSHKTGILAPISMLTLKYTSGKKSNPQLFYTILILLIILAIFFTLLFIAFLSIFFLKP